LLTTAQTVMNVPHQPYPAKPLYMSRLAKQEFQ
jgi:hypothetical protein